MRPKLSPGDFATNQKPDSGSGFGITILVFRSRRRQSYLVRGGRTVLMPSSVPAFLATRLFSWKAKLRLAWEPFVRRSKPDVEESLQGFVLRRIGQEFLDYAINPMVAGIYAGDPARLSVKEAFPKLHAVEQRYGSSSSASFWGRESESVGPKFPNRMRRRFRLTRGGPPSADRPPAQSVGTWQWN